MALVHERSRLALGRHESTAVRVSANLEDVHVVRGLGIRRERIGFTRVARVSLKTECVGIPQGLRRDAGPILMARSSTRGALNPLTDSA